MELRALIRLASDIIGYYWPMRTFVHHNPLHGLEDMRFDDAIRHARQTLGGNGYLPNELFRDYCRSGRILPRELDAALKIHARDGDVRVGAVDVRHFDVLKIHLLHGIASPPDDNFAAALERAPERLTIAALADRLSSVLAPSPLPVENASGSITTELLSTWCDRVLGTQIAEQTNREMIKWCEAFLDEGHATWPMPNREKGFYAAWKILAQQEWSPCGVKNSREKLARLPLHAEDALLASFEALGLNPEAWQRYLSLHLAALPGWAAFIKWRADQNDYEWQRIYPIDLVQYLAVRVWYERELVQQACRKAFGADISARDISGQTKPPSEQREARNFGAATNNLSPWKAAWRLTELARCLEIEAALLIQTPVDDLLRLLAWLDEFPESRHGAVWLQAFETGYREQLLDKLRPRPDTERSSDPDQEPRGQVEFDKETRVRPQGQAVFCIDVRSEPFRRYLEAVGDYETFGFAGFFAVSMRHQALGRHHETDQFPVIAKSKYLIREIPRTYHGSMLSRQRRREKLLSAGHTLLYDLKENVITPYVMVESLGWFYIVPFVGKTIAPAWYRRAMEWLRQKLVPTVSTTLTIDKLSKEEVREMLAAEQRAVTRRALQEKFGHRNLNLSLERLEFLRRRALGEEWPGEPPPQARSTALSTEEEAAFVEDLRREYGINQGASFARMERITRTGLTVGEQVFTVETVLRMIGLLRNFARLVLLCGHGSRSENNPFEAALDCGACGGNSGKPNARALAIMANRPTVREQLAKNGIIIPQDTYFIAGQHNTTTDDVELFDLEDLPPTHRKDLLQLVRDLERAGALTVQERCARFPEIGISPSASKAKREVRRRSSDWSEVRPEWGLSGNAAFIIGRRTLTRDLTLDGRVFLHSYDYREDPDGRLLEVIMTGPLVVGQWINMEHYFSTVDQQIFGSGSKIYHNVTGRLGIMSGPQSDLRTGLAWQTVMNDRRPYHEAMRLLTVIEAPRDNINRILGSQRHLQRLYYNEWLFLIAVEPQEELFYCYVPQHGWKPVKTRCSTHKSKRT
jgi:uncharacterized protein YbcC (UPF0753/DUF2309 family)